MRVGVPMSPCCTPADRTMATGRPAVPDSYLIPADLPLPSGPIWSKRGSWPSMPSARPGQGGPFGPPDAPGAAREGPIFFSAAIPEGPSPARRSGRPSAKALRDALGAGSRLPAAPIRRPCRLPCPKTPSALKMPSVFNVFVKKSGAALGRCGELGP